MATQVLSYWNHLETAVFLQFPVILEHFGLQDNPWISPLLNGRTKQHSVKIAVFMYALHANCVVSTARNGNSSFHKHP